MMNIEVYYIKEINCYRVYTKEPELYDREIFGITHAHGGFEPTVHFPDDERPIRVLLSLYVYFRKTPELFRLEYGNDVYDVFCLAEDAEVFLFVNPDNYRDLEADTFSKAIIRAFNLWSGKGNVR